MFTFSEILRFLITPIFEEYLECGYHYEQIINEAHLYTHRFNLPLDISYLDCQEKALFNQQLYSRLNQFFGIEGNEWQYEWNVTHETEPFEINRHICLDIQLAYENPIDLNEYYDFNHHNFEPYKDLHQVPESLLINFKERLSNEEFLRIYNNQPQQIQPQQIQPQEFNEDLLSEQLRSMGI